MTRFYLILLLFMLCHVHGAAQTVRAWTDCFNVGSYHEKFTDAFSTRGNPASLAFCRAFTAGIYAERRFLLDAVRHFILSAAIPVSGDGAGLQLEHFTAAGYRQSAIGIGYAKTLGRSIIGARFHYNTIVIDGYGKTGGISIEVGSNWKVTDDLRVGMCAYFPAGGNARMAYQCRSGLGYSVSGQLLLVVEAGKEENRPVSIHAGICYLPSPQWTLQLGIAASSGQPYAGMGLQWDNFRILITVSYSMWLGPGPGLAVAFVPRQTTTP